MKPFVKWAGGKTQLLDDIKNNTPKKYNTYYEPFLGGGAVFLELKPEKAIVSDVNPQLINAYVSIKNSVNDLMEAIDNIDKGETCSKEMYYNVRERYNDFIREGVDSVEASAFMIWLNHHCFNGLYRTNKQGFFNTPWNKTEKVIPSYERDNLLEISAFLNNNDITIICEDYKTVLERPEKGDFVFLDPPYVPVGKYGDFKRYTKAQFYESDQIELANMIKKITEKGVDICLTNSNTELVRSLYADFNIEVVSTHRNINSKGDSRVGEDAIITCRGTD